jgi:hypothetical protein
MKPATIPRCARAEEQAGISTLPTAMVKPALSIPRKYIALNSQAMSELGDGR